MKTWIIPYVDQPASFWEEIALQFGEEVRSVYFPMPREIVSSGRPPQPDRFLNAFLRRAPLPKTVLVNPVVLPRPAEEMAPSILAALRQLRDEYGVLNVTVTSPTLARLIKEALPELKIGASILMGISTPAQVLMIQDYVDSIILDNRILRDLRSLRRLRQGFSGEIGLIVNEACLPGCPYRVQHFYEMAYGNTFPESLCQQTLDERPWLRLTGAWILPRHLIYYEGLFDSLKLAGRVTLRDRKEYFRVLEAYVHRRDILPCDLGGGPASVLAPIDMPDELFEKILRCDKNCLACGICQDYYERALAQVK
jgi:hypothetical protein